MSRPPASGNGSGQSGAMAPLPHAAARAGVEGDAAQQSVRSRLSPWRGCGAEHVAGAPLNS